MATINYVAELKQAIHLMELEQTEKGQILRDQFYVTYESLKPINLLRNTLKELVSSPNIVDNLASTAVALATGYLSKRVMVGASGGHVRRLLASIVQYGVTNLVARRSDEVLSFARTALQLIFHGKSNKTES